MNHPDLIALFGLSVAFLSFVAGWAFHAWHHATTFKHATYFRVLLWVEKNGSTSMQVEEVDSKEQLDDDHYDEDWWKRGGKHPYGDAG